MGYTPEQQAELRARAQKIWLDKPTKPLEAGDQLVFHYALRCRCQRCGKLMEWVSEADRAHLAGVCCGLLYTLQPRTVSVEIEDLALSPLLPKLDGSDYSDPDTDLSSLTEDTQP